MEQRTFHGNLTPADLAQALLGRFNTGDFQARQIGRGANLVVQIATPAMRHSGGPTAITVQLNQVEDGVHVRLGQLQWLGTAASLGQTALMALLRPATLLSRLDDVAQDINSLTLTDQVWNTIERAVRGMGASYEITERLRRLTCAYCASANPVGAPSCDACGAPLGYQQPVACGNCGFVSEGGTTVCPECGHTL